MPSPTQKGISDNGPGAAHCTAAGHGILPAPGPLVDVEGRSISTHHLHNAALIGGEASEVEQRNIPAAWRSAAIDTAGHPAVASGNGFLDVHTTRAGSACAAAPDVRDLASEELPQPPESAAEELRDVVQPCGGAPPP